MVGRTMTERSRTSRYPSRTVIVWPSSWAAGAPAYPSPLIRDPTTSLRDYVVRYKESIDAHERWSAWFRERRALLPSTEETGGWRECRCSSCSALLADLHPPTREDGVIYPDLGLAGHGFPHQIPFAILVPGLTRELDADGKPRRDAQGRPYFGPPRRRRFRRGMSPSSDGIPRPFVRHPKGPILIHCPGCGRANELAEPRWTD